MSKFSAMLTLSIVGIISIFVGPALLSLVFAYAGIEDGGLLVLMMGAFSLVATLVGLMNISEE